ncbi:MAG: pirin family protein [Deltaproteobacteria bacterium]|nr:pirin family protein [Kofleriaceae bacterium]
MSQIVQVIATKKKELGPGVRVARVLPQIERRNVGPFVFVDHFGPVDFAPGQGMDVGPHPHIGLATVTWLFDGELTHRDSLGFIQVIRPGEVNWMTAGRGIVHSERTSDAVRAAGGRAHGLQLWVALPLGAEEVDPAFVHHGSSRIPAVSVGGVTVSVVAGAAFGVASPVETPSPLLYAIATMAPGARLTIPPLFAERAIYVVNGEVMVGGETYDRHHMLVLGEGEVTVSAAYPAHLAILGGPPLDAPRHLLWNFVASDKERLFQARDRWKAGAFPLIPGDHDELVPFPD